MVGSPLGFSTQVVMRNERERKTHERSERGGHMRVGRVFIWPQSVSLWKLNKNELNGNYACAVAAKFAMPNDHVIVSRESRDHWWLAYRLIFAKSSCLAPGWTNNTIVLEVQWNLRGRASKLAILATVSLFLACPNPEIHTLCWATWIATHSRPRMKALYKLGDKLNFKLRVVFRTFHLRRNLGSY